MNRVKKIWYVGITFLMFILIVLAGYAILQQYKVKQYSEPVISDGLDNILNRTVGVFTRDECEQRVAIWNDSDGSCWIIQKIE